jgi:hypothetical protein
MLGNALSTVSSPYSGGGAADADGFGLNVSKFCVHAAIAAATYAEHTILFAFKIAPAFRPSLVLARAP